MLPSFVIGLREGLEAALIVGIIAAFLRKQGRRDLLRSVLIGVAVAVLLCLAAGIALDLYAQNLPQQQQEGLETIIAVLAVGMVTYMVVWMRRNSRNLKGQLEGLARDALAGSTNAGRAMVLMAFLAVIREGLETVVFLLAAFNESSSGATAGVGATLGIVIAIALGYGIYRGGVRLNLSKFFRVTGFVLVLVAAGLVVNAFHTAHEAGWVEFGQARTIDLTWLVEPGTVQASLLTGMLGLQPRPVVVEVVAWLVYLIPVGLYVTWPPGRPVPTRLAVRGGLAVGLVAAAAAVTFAAIAPGRPAAQPSTDDGRITARVTSREADAAKVSTQRQYPAGRTVRVLGVEGYRLRLDGRVRHAGASTDRFVWTGHGTSSLDQPDSLGVQRVAELNNGRLPVGIRGASARIPVNYDDKLSLTVWLDTRTDRVLDLRWNERLEVIAGTAANNARLAEPATRGSWTLPRSVVDSAVSHARVEHDTLDARSERHSVAAWCGVLAALALFVAAGFWFAARRRRPDPAAASEPSAQLVKH